MHRHKIRLFRSLENAKEESRQKGLPLYVVQAPDEPVKEKERPLLTAEVRRELLRRATPELTQSLQGFLPLVQGMRLVLSSKDCVRFGIMKGCPCLLREIVFADNEVLPPEHLAGQPHHLAYMPISLVLQAEGAEWTLPSTELPATLPADVDRRGLFQLRPTHAYLSVRVEDT